MPSGVILSSASPGATKEAVEKVLAGAGLEVEKPEEDTAAVVQEPKRDAFETDEEFEAAHVEWQDKQKEPEAKGGDEEEEEEQPPKKLSKFKKRISRIVAPLERENQELKARIKALEKGGKKEEPKPVENPRPKRADFTTDEEYEDALVAWGTAKAIADQAAKDAQKEENERLGQNLQNYRAQVEEFKEEHDDWDEVVNQDIPMHVGVQLAIMEQENGAEVVYYLGRHPEYAKKLAEMTPLSAVMEVGRLSARLTAGSGSPGSGAGHGDTTKNKSRVPPPVRPVSTAATSSTLTSRDAAAKRDYKGWKAAVRQGR
jgi:hypothetical protein